MIIDAKEFTRFAGCRTNGPIFGVDNQPLTLVRDVSAAIEGDVETISNRKVTYRFADEKVARDGHTVSVAGFDLNGFYSNPVFLWAHDASEPPIGRVVDLTRQNGVLKGTVEYADAELNPFADMIYRMVRKRFLNATSISWLPVEWKFSQDRNRPGGIDFIKEDLLEISQVPVPAQVTALATARAAGIDTSPMQRWAEKILDGGSTVTVPRVELEQLRAAAQGESIRLSIDDEARRRRQREAEALMLAGACP